MKPSIQCIDHIQVPPFAHLWHEHPQKGGEFGPLLPQRGLMLPILPLLALHTRNIIRHHISSSGVYMQVSFGGGCIETKAAMALHNI